MHDLGLTGKPENGAHEFDPDGLADLKPAAGDQHPPSDKFSTGALKPAGCPAGRSVADRSPVRVRRG